ncbi:MAG: hypothetical protein ACIALR_04705 [Blastopirellula sp. JB062]
MATHRLKLTIFLLISTLFFAEIAQGQFRELTRKVPNGANTLLMIDVEKLHHSPLGQKERWREQQEKLFAAGLEIVPPTASQFVGAAKLKFKEMAPDWQVAVMKLAQEPSLPKLAVQYQGTLDKLVDREVAVLPGDVYAVQIGPNIVAAGMPANRQDVARWLRQYDANSLAGLSTYLQEAESFAENSSPIIMAIDLQGVVSQSAAKARLADTTAATELKTDLDALSQALASIRGVTLGVSVGEAMTGAVKVDFEQDVSALGAATKDVLLDALADHGLMLDDFKSWAVTVEPKQIQITGPLSLSGLRHILSLLDTPAALSAQHESAETTDEDEKRKLTILATQSYFLSVTSLLDDLRHDKKDRKTLGQISVWFGNYARKIDRLPMLNVDPDMLDYGQLVSTTLRTGRMDVTAAAAASRLRQQQVPDQVNVHSYGWYGWSTTSDPAATAKAKAQVRTQQQIRGARSANTVMQNLEIATHKIRRHMTQKYQVEF